MIKKIHPYFIAVLPSLFIGSRNIAEVPFSSIFITSVLSITVTAFALTFLNMFFKNKERNAFWLSLFFILTFSYGVIYNKVSSFFPGNGQTLGLLLIVTLYTLYLLSVFLFYKINKLFEVGNVFIGYLSLSMLSFIAITTIQQPSFTSKIQKIPAYISAKFNSPSESTVATTTTLRKASNEYPDIYYIIVDGYARNDTLTNTFHFNNSKFTKYLTNKGFYIAHKSSSNYPMTHLSLASSLSMEYINPVLKQYGNKDNNPYFELIKNARITTYLKEAGYDYITIASGWGPTNEPSIHSDYHFNRKLSALNNYYQSILMQTPLKPWLGINEAKLRLFAFTTLAHIPKLNTRPKFTFLHLVMPHAPYLFDRKGNIVDLSGAMYEHRSQKEQYIEQLQFLNDKLIETIDTILAKSTKTPIIIIQADHGSEISLENFKMGPPSLEQIRERFAIFNAYYGPAEFKEKLYPTITPVNSFRIILNALKIGNWDNLPDKNYFQWYFDDSQIYDVTSQFTAMNTDEA